MVHPEEIREKAQRRWKDYLKAKVNGQMDFFPLAIPCDKNFSNLSSKEFEKAITLLQMGSKVKKGYGYSLHNVCKDTKRFGVQNVPERITIDSEDDFLKLTGREEEAGRFFDIFRRTMVEFPELKECLTTCASVVIENYNDWEGILKVCRFFRHTPCPNRFVRELNIGVHTKFVETHIKILRPLLNVIVGDKVNQNASTFYSRFNLKEGDPQVTFRILDGDLCKKYLSGFTFNTVYLCEFCKLDIPIEKVIVMENKLNVTRIVELLPDTKATLVVWGSGYKANILKDVDWMNKVELFYWGDMDVQGYEILAQFRSYFPHVKSLMMNKTAMEVHPHQGTGVESKRIQAIALDEEEQIVYELVRDGNLRYEQEYLPEWFVRNTLMETLSR